MARSVPQAKRRARFHPVPRRGEYSATFAVERRTDEGPRWVGTRGGERAGWGREFGWGYVWLRSSWAAPMTRPVGAPRAHREEPEIERREEQVAQAARP